MRIEGRLDDLVGLEPPLFFYFRKENSPGASDLSFPSDFPASLAIPVKNEILFAEVIPFPCFHISFPGILVPGCDPDEYRNRGDLRPRTGSYTELEKAPEVKPVEPPEYPTYDPAAPQNIVDHIVTAFEGGSVSWMDKALPVSDTTKAKPWYSDPKFYEGEWQIEITTNDDDPVTAYLNQEKWDNGLKLLYSRHPKHWDDMMTDNSDAITSDVLIQLALFGKLVYG